jgi:hypothetical protein
MTARRRRIEPTSQQTGNVAGDTVADRARTSGAGERTMPRSGHETSAPSGNGKVVHALGISSVPAPVPVGCRIVTREPFPGPRLAFGMHRRIISQPEGAAMPQTTEPAAADKPVRNTGDWRGWPQFMIFVTAVLIVAGVIGGLVIGTGNSDNPYVDTTAMGWAFFARCEVAAFALYSLTAIIAALRGILSTQREVWRNTGITAQHHMHQ